MKIAKLTVLGTGSQPLGGGGGMRKKVKGSLVARICKPTVIPSLERPQRISPRIIQQV